MPSVRGGLTFAVAMVALGVVLATTLSTPDQFVYGKIFSIGIVALSLVPLVGFAGQISLCQLSFAGIGAVVMAHLGASGDPLALLWAVLIAAAVGAVVALPALRLSGIYLALGTASFAVVLDRWVWNLPKFEVFGWFQVNLFAQGSVGRAAPQGVRHHVRQTGRADHPHVDRLRARRAARHLHPPRPARPPTPRHEGQRGRVRHARPEPARHQAPRVLASRRGSPGSAVRSTRCS